LSLPPETRADHATLSKLVHSPRHPLYLACMDNECPRTDSTVAQDHRKANKIGARVRPADHSWLAKDQCANVTGIETSTRAWNKANHNSIQKTN